MSKKSIYFKALLVFLFLSAGVVQGRQKTPWKGTLEIDKGIRVIKNPAEPLYGDIKLDLQEELSIGSKSSAEYAFHLISDVKSDNQGNIYIADTKNLRVQKFDSNGKYIKTLGKGVDKFQQPSKIEIDKTSENIFIRASLQDIEIFDGKDQYKNGVHLKKNPTRGDFVVGYPTVITYFRPIDSDHVMAILGVEYHYKNSRVIRSIFRLDSNSNPKSLSKEYLHYALVDDGYGGWDATGTDFEPDLYLAKIDEKSYICGYSKEYELNVFDSEGKILYRIKKNSSRPIFTKEERKRFRLDPVPEFKAYFYNLLTDSKGRIYVQRNITKGFLNAVQENTNREVDIFSKDGYFLYTSTLPPNTCEIKDGFLYAYSVSGASGLESVKRQKIKNWDNINERIDQ